MPEEPPEPLCEFTNPCTTASETTTTTNGKDGKKNTKNPSNPRKVISHIFGRNKTSTKLFPTSVWVHYCRKHYQRARYRSTQWPFTQCELLLDSLARMERWGGVRCFELVLRRREVERVDGDYGSGAVAGSGATRGGRLLRSRARTENGEEEEDGDEGSGSVSTLTSTSNNTNADDDDYSSSSSNPKPHGTSKSKSKSAKRRKTPLIEPAPVPNWLRLEVGGNKSFDDIRDITHRLSDYLTHLREQGRRDEIRFPDIEILPEFRGWVLRDAAAASVGQADRDEEGRGDGVRGQKRGRGMGKARKSGRNVGRVSGRGAVQKA